MSIKCEEKGRSMLYFSRCRGTVAHLCVIHHNTIHLLERSPRTLPYLPLHGTTHASTRSSSAAKFNKMAQGALNPRIAEPCGPPREFDGGTERSAACELRSRSGAWRCS